MRLIIIAVMFAIVVICGIGAVVIDRMSKIDTVLDVNAELIKKLNDQNGRLQKEVDRLKAKNIKGEIHRHNWK